MAEYKELQSTEMGICVSCLNRQGPVEPDARDYRCDSCGENQVFGIEELLIAGKLEIIEEESNAK